jgi:hypothetical protein
MSKLRKDMIKFGLKENQLKFKKVVVGNDHLFEAFMYQGVLNGELPIVISKITVTDKYTQLLLGQQNIQS